MKRIVLTGVVVGFSAVTLLAGCITDDGAGSGRTPAVLGPTARTTAVPEAAARLAERYRRAGGQREVYGIERSAGRDGVPLLVVRTHDPDDSARTFDRLKTSVVGFLEREEGLSASEGYLMDIFGPDGSLQHRLDARV
ncbi:hypothetical protein [Streptomyces sp. NPDC057428]|uniref:hypothetical protein n=1 Tax=Streptomyces sp. NPDC057428 TaxID=3346129 RepID=UPI0036B430E9